MDYKTKQLQFTASQYKFGMEDEFRCALAHTSKCDGKGKNCYMCKQWNDLYRVAHISGKPVTETDYVLTIGEKRTVCSLEVLNTLCERIDQR